ncbi:MAG: DinB family protein [Chloroflexota bacterium]
MVSEQKAHLLEALSTARERLWTALERFDPDAEVFPGWNKRDFFAHIGGWEALVYGALRDHAAGVPGTGKYPFKNMDEANAHLVGVRQSLTLDAAKLECEINRYAIERMLLDIPGERYGEEVQFPWGSESIASFLQDAIKHENEHAAEIEAIQD